MPPVRRNPVSADRSRARQHRLVRLGVRVPEGDAPLLRDIAVALRGDPAWASVIRVRMREALQPASGRTLLDLLACDLPDEVVDEALARPCDLGREVPL